MSIPGMIGSIDHYVVGKSFSNYIERFEILCNLNKVTAETKRSWFISLSGDDVFDEIKLLFPYQEVNTLQYDDIIKKLKTRFDKTDPVLMKRYHFYNRGQGPNESGENFVLAVKLLAEGCNFKDFKTEAIRDKLILGLRDSDLQHKLLMEDEIELATVEKTIVSAELAAKQRKTIRENNEGASSVLSVKHRLGRRNAEYSDNYSNPPSRFRSRSRSNSNCRESGNKTGYNNNDRYNGDVRRDGRNWNNHFNAVCNYCKKKGHIRKHCRFLNKNSVKFVENVPKEKETLSTDKFNRMRLQESSDESDIDCMKIGSVNSVTDPCLVKACVAK